MDPKFISSVLIAQTWALSIKTWWREHGPPGGMLSLENIDTLIHYREILTSRRYEESIWTSLMGCALCSNGVPSWCGTVLNTTQGQAFKTVDFRATCTWLTLKTQLRRWWLRAPLKNLFHLLTGCRPKRRNGSQLQRLTKDSAVWIWFCPLSWIYHLGFSGCHEWASSMVNAHRKQVFILQAVIHMKVKWKLKPFYQGTEQFPTTGQPVAAE